MLILITLDIRDHLARTHHFLVACKVIEEGKCTVEEDSFQNQVGHKCFEERLRRSIITEVLINIGDELVALQQNRIMLPIFKDFLLLLFGHDGGQYIRIRLVMDNLLLTDDRGDRFKRGIGEVALNVAHKHRLHGVQHR
ncbi:hypothetical protein D3C81_1195690 [compost metagenome]